MRDTFEAMKKRESKVISIILGFSVLLFFFHMNRLSSIAKSNETTSTTQGKELQLKRQDPPHQSHQHFPRVIIVCDRSHYNYDICSIKGPTVLDPITSTFYALKRHGSTKPHVVVKVRPYPRKWENPVMSQIKEIRLTSGPSGPICDIHHKAPAIVFSAGGYTGNFFHEMSDGFIPLFITIHSISPNHTQDFVLVISKSRDWWVSKYADLLHAFTKYPIVNLDNDTSTHCFPSVTVGLISHGSMTINSTLLPSSKNLSHFRVMLETAYRTHPAAMICTSNSRPRLVWVKRESGSGREILNEGEAKQAAEDMGFEVIAIMPSATLPLREAYSVVNSSHAMVGVHGAALTHSLFLRPGSIFIQVVPIGIDWAADVCFGKPAKDLELEYMEYKIEVEESSLVDKYGRNNSLIYDPKGVQKKLGWSKEFVNIYLKEQNVKLDLIRFKGYLTKAYNKAKNFMDKHC